VNKQRIIAVRVSEKMHKQLILLARSRTKESLEEKGLRTSKSQIIREMVEFSFEQDFYQKK